MTELEDQFEGFAPWYCEKTLFNVWSNDWNKFMPVRLIHYMNSDDADLHCQTGDHLERALQIAKEQLSLSGLTIDTDDTFTGPTGIYYTVKKID